MARHPQGPHPGAKASACSGPVLKGCHGRDDCLGNCSQVQQGIQAIRGTRRLRATLSGPPRLPDSKSLFLAPWKATLNPKRLGVSTMAPFDKLGGETSACFRAQCGFSQKTSFPPQFPLRRGSSVLSAACPGWAPALRSQGLGCSLQKFRPGCHKPKLSFLAPTDIPAVAFASSQTSWIFFPPSIPTLLPKQELFAVHLPAQQKFHAANGDRSKL